MSFLRKQRELKFPPLEIGAEIPVRHYGGYHTWTAKLIGFTKSRSAVLDFGYTVGTREVWLYKTKTRTPGRFKEKSMHHWHVDEGVLERLRSTYEH